MRICKKLNYPKDIEEIKKAYQIDLKVWNVKSSFDDFISRAKHGFLIALYEDNNLKGTISALTQFKNEVLSLKKFSTWNGITDNGTFKNANPNGDTLVCVAITSINAITKNNKYEFISKFEIKNPKLKTLINEISNNTYTSNTKLKNFITENIHTYLSSNIDSVINFHKKDKIITEGAKIIKIFRNGRKEDHDSLGYNILMQYPMLNNEIKEKLSNNKITCENTGYGKALIIGTIQEATKQSNIRYIMPYSRPADYKYYLLKALIFKEYNLKANENEKYYFSKTLEELKTENLI